MLVTIQARLSNLICRADYAQLIRRMFQPSSPAGSSMSSRRPEGVFQITAILSLLFWFLACYFRPDWLLRFATRIDRA